MRRRAAAVIAALMLWPVAGFCQARGGAEVILTVTTDEGHRHELTRARLDDMPQTGFVTTTIWTQGPQAFRGVTLRDMLVSLGEEAQRVTLVAANGYQVERPTEEMMPDGALLSYERNGAAMSLRDKGPVWLVYDYDSDADYRTEVIYANSIWQLDRIELAH